MPTRGPTIQQLPTSYDLHEDYEVKGSTNLCNLKMAMIVVNSPQCIPDSAERYRNRVLERQLQDMARSHAREKQGLMTKLEDLK